MPMLDRKAAHQAGGAVYRLLGVVTYSPHPQVS